MRFGRVKRLLTVVGADDPLPTVKSPDGVAALLLLLKAALTVLLVVGGCDDAVPKNSADVNGV